MKIIAISMAALLSGAAFFIDTEPMDLIAATEKVGELKNIESMGTDRAAHAATLLDDGRVLVTGGFRTGGGSLTSAEIFITSTGRFAAASNMTTARAGHTSTRLSDGKVLIAGGFDGGYLQTTEIFDPATGRFSPGPPLTVPRSEHTATSLADGRILIAGGVGTGWRFLSEAEVYDPAAGRFLRIGSMTVPRESHTATLLKDGRVLITGGHKGRRESMTVYNSTEVFDPTRNSFESLGELTVRRHKHAAILLNDGRVLVAGGSDERDSRGSYDSLETFDPKSGRFMAVGRMRAERYKLNGTLVLLRDGTVLIAGGSDVAEIFDPVKKTTLEAKGSFGTDRLFSSATCLNDGRVLIVGGYDQSNRVSGGAWMFERSVD
ncbi:MAG: hypothetical protein IPM25_20060 [Chloracidobacterium sp.]|nr:hypothetical protein [Chloracidobacterium sp.]